MRILGISLALAMGANAVKANYFDFALKSSNKQTDELMRYPLTECKVGTNPISTCDVCAGSFEQLFISGGCDSAFVCNGADNAAQEGCHYECDAGYLIHPLFSDGGATIDFECVEDAGQTCPGEFKIFCPEDDIGTVFNAASCQCDGQLLISSDCKHGESCTLRYFLQNKMRQKTLSHAVCAIIYAPMQQN